MERAVKSLLSIFHSFGRVIGKETRMRLWEMHHRIFGSEDLSSNPYIKKLDHH